MRHEARSELLPREPAAGRWSVARGSAGVVMEGRSTGPWRLETTGSSSPARHRNAPLPTTCANGCTWWTYAFELAAGAR